MTSQAAQLRNDAAIDLPATPSALPSAVTTCVSQTQSIRRGVCRQCHRSFALTSVGHLRHHGPKGRPCAGSGQQADVNAPAPGITVPQTTPRAYDSLHFPRVGPVMKFVPKAARHAVACAFNQQLRNCVTNPNELKNWDLLFSFANHVLQKPLRGGVRQKLGLQSETKNRALQYACAC